MNMERVSGLGFRKNYNIHENDFSDEKGEYSPEQGYLFATAITEIIIVYLVASKVVSPCI